MVHKQVGEGEGVVETTATVSEHVAVPKVAAAQEDLYNAHKNDHTPSTTAFLVGNLVQFAVALVLLKIVSLQGIFFYGVLGFLIVYFMVQLHLGPNSMPPRRKMMIATFSPPDSGMIFGTLTIDMTKTFKYIEEKRQASGSHVTITHLVLRALGTALANAPSLNGHIVFGRYYPAPTVNICALVAVEGGKDLGVTMLESVDKMSIQDVCDAVRSSAGKLRTGKDKAQSDRNKLMQYLPTWVIRIMVNVSGWLANCLGLRIKAVGVEPYMFGSCMVTSVGMMGMELAFAPLTPYSQTPMLVTIGATRDTPVVVDGEVVVRPILTLTTTIDHRYMDGSQAARIAKTVRALVENPYEMEPVELPASK